MSDLIQNSYQGRVNEINPMEMTPGEVMWATRALRAEAELEYYRKKELGRQTAVPITQEPQTISVNRIIPTLHLAADCTIEHNNFGVHVKAKTRCTSLGGYHVGYYIEPNNYRPHQIATALQDLLPNATYELAGWLKEQTKMDYI